MTKVFLFAVCIVLVASRFKRKHYKANEDKIALQTTDTTDTKI